MPITNKKSLLNDELKFLVNCCKTDPSEEDTIFILSYLNTLSISTMSRQEMPLGCISMANNHGILPLIYKTIKQYNMQHFLSKLQPHYFSTVQHNMSMSADLIKILDLLTESDIKALSFKGPSLAQMVYGDITLRQYGDLDILIEKKDIKKVEALCKSMGYIPYLVLTDVQKEIWYTYAKDMVFFHPVKKSYLEMHWLLLDADFPLQVDLNAIWEHTETVEVNRCSIQTFCVDTLLLYLCIHGSKHLWERMVWIKDIDLMIRTQNIHWEDIVVNAKKNNLQNMLFLGLYLSMMLFDTPLPKNIQNTLEDEKVLPELSDFVFLNWETPQGMFQNTRAMLKFFPTLKMKVLYLHKVILKPSKNEYRFIDLPKGFYWVYYLVRPYLLMKKYLSKS